MAGIAALAIGYVLSQFYRSFLAVLTPVLSSEVGMSNFQLSLASGAWFITFALSQFGVGISLDRFGPRRTASILLAACGAGGAVLFATATAPWTVVAAMALIGIGCSPVLMATLFIFAHSYSAARFAVLASWLIAFGTAGNVVGASPLANAAEAFGWRPVLLALAAFTLMTAMLIHFLVRDPTLPQTEPAAGSGLSGYLELLRMPLLWPIIPITALNYAPVSGIRGLWAGPYLSEVFGADTLLIGRVTLLMALGMVAGSMLYGPLDTLLRTRKWVAMAGNSVSVLALLILVIQPQPPIAMVFVLFVVIGVAGGSFGVLMAHARAFVPAHLTGRGVTLMNFFTIGGVGLMQFATGAVFAANEVPDSPTTAYVWLFAFYAALLALAILVYLFSRDARPEQ